MVSKSLSTSRKFAALGDEFAQVLYLLLVSHCDDFGRQSGDAFTVKHQVFPTSPRSEAEFSTALENLARNGLILRDTTEGSEVLQVVGFEQHQTGLHKRSASRFPEVPGISGNFREIPSELNRREQNLTEQNGTDTKTTPKERAGGLIISPLAFARLQETHAYVGAKLRVPNALHSELMAKSGANADQELRAWYSTLDADLEQSGKATGDVFQWLRPRHQAFAVHRGWIEPAPKPPAPKPAFRSVTQMLADANALKNAGTK